MPPPSDDTGNLLRAMAAQMLELRIGDERLKPLAAIVDRLIAFVAQQSAGIEADSDPNEFYVSLHRISADSRRKHGAR